MKHLTIPKLLKKYGVRPNKKLGQHFLMEPALIDKLIDALELYPDEDVLEIGSGLGFLSYQVAKHALEVVAIEKDHRLFEIAGKEFGEQKNLKFHEGDFLKIDLPHLVSDYHLPMKVIGNIPYNISTPILFKLLENHSLFQLAVLTVQKEVAKRITAEPGNKDYGVLTIMVQAEAICESLFDIEAGSFLPPPEVSSRAIKVTFPRTPLHMIHKPSLFRTVVKTAFATRRKILQNTLKKLLKNNKIEPWEACQIDPKLRPEEIPVDKYVALANFLAPLL